MPSALITVSGHDAESSEQAGLMLVDEALERGRDGKAAAVCLTDEVDGLSHSRHEPSGSRFCYEGSRSWSRS